MGKSITYQAGVGAGDREADRQINIANYLFTNMVRIMFLPPYIDRDSRSDGTVLPKAKDRAGPARAVVGRQFLRFSAVWFVSGKGDLKQIHKGLV